MIVHLCGQALRVYGVCVFVIMAGWAAEFAPELLGTKEELHWRDQEP